MDSAFGSGGQRQIFDAETEHFATEEQQGAHRLILSARRHATSNREMRQEVADRLELDARVGLSLLLGDVGEEPSHRVGVAALSAVGEVARANPRPEKLERRERVRVPGRVDAGALRRRVPVGAFEEVDEADPEWVFCLMHLPILATSLLEFLAEAARLVCYWRADGRTAKKMANWESRRSQTLGIGTVRQTQK